MNILYILRLVGRSGRGGGIVSVRAWCCRHWSAVAGGVVRRGSGGGGPRALLWLSRGGYEGRAAAKVEGPLFSGGRVLPGNASLPGGRGRVVSAPGEGPVRVPRGECRSGGAPPWEGGGSLPSGGCRGLPVKRTPLRFFGVGGGVSSCSGTGWARGLSSGEGENFWPRGVPRGSCWRRPPTSPRGVSGRAFLVSRRVRFGVGGPAWAADGRGARSGPGAGRFVPAARI